MQVRNIIRTSNLLRFSCPLRHQITAPFHHDPDSRVLSISLNSRELTLSLFLNKNRAREREEKRRKVIEREREEERETKKKSVSHITWPPCPWGTTTTTTNRRRRLYIRRNRRSLSRNPKFLAGAPIWRQIRYFRSLYSSRTLGVVSDFPELRSPSIRLEAPASPEFRPIYRFSVLARDFLRRRR